MATWPSTLPSPLVSGYGINPQDQTVRTDMEVGLPRQRRRTSGRNDNLDAQWLMTDAELGTFRTWFDGDGDGGAAWFTVTLTIGNGGTDSVTARFIGPWKAVPAAGGLKWVVSGRLEVRES